MDGLRSARAWIAERPRTDCSTPVFGFGLAGPALGLGSRSARAWIAERPRLDCRADVSGFGAPECDFVAPDMDYGAPVHESGAPSLDCEILPEYSPR
eukprot:4952886-Alexandrium_andersonii.AAC.1